MELMAVMSTGLILMTASTRLWTGLQVGQPASPRHAAQALCSTLDEAMQTSRGLGAPVAVACAEAPGEAGQTETRLMLLRGLQTTDADIAVGWPMRLGAEKLWRQEGQVRRLSGVKLVADGGTFSRSDLEWRVVTIATPDGAWAVTPRSTSTWAQLAEPQRIHLEAYRRTPDLRATNVILHVASPRPVIEEER